MKSNHGYSLLLSTQLQSLFSDTAIFLLHMLDGPQQERDDILMAN